MVSLKAKNPMRRLSSRQPGTHVFAGALCARQAEVA